MCPHAGGHVIAAASWAIETDLDGGGALLRLEGGLSGREVRRPVLDPPGVRSPLALLEVGGELIFAWSGDAAPLRLDAVAWRDAGVMCAQLVITIPALSPEPLGGFFPGGELPKSWSA